MTQVRAGLRCRDGSEQPRGFVSEHPAVGHRREAGQAPDVPKGYTEIRAKFRVKAKPGDLQQIAELAGFSPVFNTITQGAKPSVLLIYNFELPSTADSRE